MVIFVLLTSNLSNYRLCLESRLILHLPRDYLVYKNEFRHCSIPHGSSRHPNTGSGGFDNGTGNECSTDLAHVRDRGHRSSEIKEPD